MKAQAFFFSEYVKQTGMDLTILGIVSDLEFEKFPGQLERVFAVATVLFEKAEQGVHTLEIEVVSPSAVRVFHTQAAANCVWSHRVPDRPFGIAQIVLNFRNLSFPARGLYMASLKMDQIELAVSWLWVREKSES